jgi:hypothetical protein
LKSSQGILIKIFGFVTVVPRSYSCPITNTVCVNCTSFAQNCPTLSKSFLHEQWQNIQNYKNVKKTEKQYNKNNSLTHFWYNTKIPADESWVNLNDHSPHLVYFTRSSCDILIYKIWCKWVYCKNIRKSQEKLKAFDNFQYTTLGWITCWKLGINI